jgi:hypothetical protein
LKPTPPTCIGQVAADTLTYDDTTAVPGWYYYYWVLATNSTSESTGNWSLPDIGYRTPISNATASLALDGREMVRAEVTANSDGDHILVLHAINGMVTNHPQPQTVYTQGQALVNARIVYKGAAGGFREHVVHANVTNHYRIYSIQEDLPYYSEGLIPGTPIITMPFQSNISTETFSYTNVALHADSFTNKAGGNGWSDSWSLSQSGTGYHWEVQTNAVAGMPAFKLTESNYPTVVGNRAVLLTGDDPGSGFARRTIAPTNTGNVFVGAVVAYKWHGTGKFMTIGLMNGDDTEVEFGKVYGRNNYFDIRRHETNGNSSYVMNGWGEADQYTNNWFWMVIKYSFTNDTAYAKCFWKGEGIPHLEPAHEDWDVIWPDMDISEIDGIELKAGSDSGTLGGAVWDEIRVSHVWPELIGQPGLVPYPSLVDFGEVESTLSSTVTVYIANSGGDNVPLYVTNDPSMWLEGPDAASFAISTNRFDNLLTYLQSNSLNVTFWPTNTLTTPYSATLWVSNNSGVNPYPLEIIGTGVPTVSTNVPMVSNYFVGQGRWLTDAMVTSGVYSVTAEVYHVRGILEASYDILNANGDFVVSNEPFSSWQSDDGMAYTLADESRAGYWPATPATNYLLRVRLTASNLISHTNTLFTADGVVTAGDLFFTEYVEGSSFNKALEIFNGTGAAVDLGEYGIRMQMNNGTEWGNYEYMPTQMLAPGATFVIVHSSAGAELRARAHFTNDNMCSFNGDDSIFLMKGQGEEDPVDAIGSSPSGGNVMMDMTLRRLTSVTNANPIYNPLEWSQLAIDTQDGLGAHEMDGALGRRMDIVVEDDDPEEPEITWVRVNDTEPSESAPGPDILRTDIPESGMPVTWNILDVESGLFAASNRFILRTGSTVVASGYITQGVDGDGRDAPLTVSNDIAKALMLPGDYHLGVSGQDVDPEWVGDSLTASNQYFFRVLAPLISVAPDSLSFGQVGIGLTSNLVVTVSNSGNMTLNIFDLDFNGTGYALFEADQDNLSVEPGETADVTVYFTPAGGGNFNWTLTLINDSANDPALVVPLSGSCYDPETMPPEILAYSVRDGRNLANNVTDHAGAHGEITAAFTLYQYTGMRSDSATLDLIYPDGTLAVQNVPLSVTGSATNDGRLCSIFTGYPPPFYPATLGVYTARVTAVSSNGIQMVAEVTYQAQNSGIQQLVETFSGVTSNNSTYAVGAATGDWGSWTYTGTRWDQTLDGKAPTIGASGTLTSPTLSNGVTAISFDYRRPFSETGAFNYDVLVNGAVVGTVTAMPPTTATIFSHNISGLNYTGDVVISFINRTNSNKRMAIDNITILTPGSDGSAMMTFEVIDEDEDGPEHSDFNVDGAAFSTNDFAAGLVVTGFVMDAQSGVYAASNLWYLLSNGVIGGHVGRHDHGSGLDGEGISNVTAMLTATIPFEYLNTVDEQFLFRVVSTDYDNDRENDWLSTTSEYSFGITAYVPAPTDFEAVADGAEMVEMTWDRNGAANVVLLWATNPITVNSLTRGVDYAVHDTPGNARVLYVGDATRSKWWCRSIPPTTSACSARPARPIRPPMPSPPTTP